MPAIVADFKVAKWSYIGSISILSICDIGYTAGPKQTAFSFLLRNIYLYKYIIVSIERKKEGEKESKITVESPE